MIAGVQEVFQSTDKHIGWDGKYKGQLLPMDVYAYTLMLNLLMEPRQLKQVILR